MKKREDIPTVSASSVQLKSWLAQLCPKAGIEVVGVVPLPCQLPHRHQWEQWIKSGRHGGLEYLTREPENRTNPSIRNPWARSILVMAHRYTAGWPKNDSAPSSGGLASYDSAWTDRVSRYARGNDYHSVLLKSIKQVVRELKLKIPGLEAFASTDTGPYLEREYAWLAGLGFLGHNQCLIHEKLGSGMFLGVALTNLLVEDLPNVGTPAMEALYAVSPRRNRTPEFAPVNMCGSCTRCLDACPTNALDISKGLDANLCLSTWSIEWQGRAPENIDHLQDGLLFGCDICQAVCPWNNRADRFRHSQSAVNKAYNVLETHNNLTLSDLEKISDEDFRHRFRKTPLWRCHPQGMRRNALLVKKNLLKGEEDD